MPCAAGAATRALGPVCLIDGSDDAAFRQHKIYSSRQPVQGIVTLPRCHQQRH
jgi:hypothetical protein